MEHFNLSIIICDLFLYVSALPWNLIMFPFLRFSFGLSNIINSVSEFSI
jgi:F0F1-type ATP synthase assembly protein I